MAKIQMGVIVTDIRGKLNGNQFSKGRAGNVLQRKCQQKKGATPKQSTQRSLFSSLSRFWRTLTDVQRAANNAATVNYPVTDKFGNTVYLSGYQLLLRSNLNLNTAGLPAIPEVPNTPPDGNTLVLEFTEMAISGPTTFDFLLEWENLTGPLDDRFLVIYSSNGQSAGVSTFNGEYVFIGSVPLATGFVTIQSTAINQRLIVNAGNRVFVIADVLDAISGVVVASYSVQRIAAYNADFTDVTLTSGVSWNIFIDFDGYGSIVPPGSYVVLSITNGAVPVPSNPAILAYTQWLTLLAGDYTNPFLEPTPLVVGTANYFYVRAEFFLNGTSVPYSTQYQYTLYA